VETFRITAEWIHDHASGSGGWNLEQLRTIGVQWPPRHGWIYRSIGREITLEAREAFENLKGVTAAIRRKENQLSLDLPEGAAEHLKSF
jgi:hypothetical protein